MQDAPIRYPALTPQTIVQTIQTAQPQDAPRSVAVALPQPEPTKIWPGDFTPTTVIRIPDGDRKSSGVLDLTFHRGDDVKFEVRQWWEVKCNNIPANLEWSDNEMVKFEKEGIRVIRFRIKKDTVEKLDVRFLVEKHPSDSASRGVAELAGMFGPLRIVYRRLQGTGGNHEINIDLDFENRGNQPLAVALLGEATSLRGDPRFKASIVDSGGVEFWGQQSAGLHVMYADPNSLTQISPGETRHVSLTFRTTWNGSPNTRSCRLRCEFILNPAFDGNSYATYSVDPGVLPPGCRIENLIWEIPVTQTR